MNFVIEVIKKRENANELVFVVRRQDGFPLLVADNLDDAKEFIAEKVNQALQTKVGGNKR